MSFGRGRAARLAGLMSRCQTAWPLEERDDVEQVAAVSLEHFNRQLATALELVGEGAFAGALQQ